MITDLLQPGGIRKGVWIVVLMVFNALLDFFSIAAFVTSSVVYQHGDTH